MSGDYPTEEELDRLRSWDANDPSGWFAFAKQVGQYWPDADPWGWDETDGVYHISTGGWSGNEDIIDAMKGNFVLWAMWWQSTRRGGHYTFALRSPDAP